MLVESLGIFLAIVLLRMEDLLTLLARPATSAARQDILAETAPKRLQTGISLLTLLTLVLLPLLPRLHQLHRPYQGSPHSIGRDELSISLWNWLIGSPFCIWT